MSTFTTVLSFSQVAMKHPAAVTACNLDLENLITDVNRSIATLAITTLLKTGSETSVDRLMKQISSFMSEISDEFKIVVVQAIRLASRQHFCAVLVVKQIVQERQWKAEQVFETQTVSHIGGVQVCHLSLIHI